MTDYRNLRTDFEAPRTDVEESGSPSEGDAIRAAPLARRAVFSHDAPVGEVGATALGRSVSAVLDRVEDGERIVLTRNRRAVAVVVGLEDGIDIMLAGSERFAILRREAREELERGLTETLTAWRAGSPSS